MAYSQIFAGITEFINGPKNLKADIKGSYYTDAYVMHIANLEEIKNSNPLGYHSLMATLFINCRYSPNTLTTT
jgi:hypothetical protein